MATLGKRYAGYDRVGEEPDVVLGNVATQGISADGIAECTLDWREPVSSERIGG